MNFILESTLEHIALIKIVVILWNQNDIRGLIAHFSIALSGDSRSTEWQKIEDRVIEKVTQLSLPEYLKEKIEGLIRPIGHEILEWVKYHFSDSLINVNLPSEFIWTSIGIMDRKKIAKVIIRDENLDICKRYRLACIYCLEDDVSVLWNKMPSNLRQQILYESYNSNISIQNLLIIWTRKMQERKCFHALFSLCQDTFVSSVQCGNKVAAEYFFQKSFWTLRDREAFLLRAAEHVVNTNDVPTDVLCYLLSQMDEEHQIKFCKNNCYIVLLSFLDWPLQSFFIEIATHVWDHLLPVDYRNLLKEILLKRKNGYKDWNYEKLFIEFWKKSPESLKSNLIDKDFLPYLLCMITDKEILKLILQDASLVVKKKPTYCKRMESICNCLIRGDEWDLLEFFISMCLPSEDKNKWITFKEEFEKSIEMWSSSDSVKLKFLKNKEKWEHLFNLSDDLLCKSNKRSIEISESSSTKQFRIHEA